MQKILFIYNPCSGTGKIKSSLSDVVDIFTKNGYEVTVYPTQFQGDCTRRVNAAAIEDFDRVVVAGGDGMLHEMIVAASDQNSGHNSDPNAKMVIGYIPTGTVNDFAASHCIPRNINEAAENAVQGQIVPIDTAGFNETYFSYVAAFGMITHVAYQTDQREKNKLGSFAYLLEIMKSIDLKHFNEASCFMEITAGEQSVSGEFIFGAVTNSTSLGSMRNFFPDDVKFDDGILEGIFIKRPKTLIELEQLKTGLVNKNLNAPCIECIRSAEFQLKAERDIAWTLDGENGGSHSTVNIKVVPKAIQIALPCVKEN